VALGALALAAAFRRKLLSRLSGLTQLSSFAASPAPAIHDPVRDRATIHVARDGTPAENIDAVLAKCGGIASVVGPEDVVIVKVSAQWWNQGMTNVAAAKRLIEQILERDGFKGEIILFENTHFRMADGSGLSRAWVRPSERNVDVPGFNKLGDLITHFRGQKGRDGKPVPVGFVGLVDAGPSALSDDTWHDPSHELGTYGGDGRGPIAPGEDRDGYHWDFEQTFRLAKSLVGDAKSPLTWPRFTSPTSGLVIDLRDGVLRRDGGKLVPANRKLTWINMTTANEHGATGFTGACKSTMGVVDMSAGALGTHPLARGYSSTHYFGDGRPSAKWRMAGPLAHFARRVRSPDLILLVAEWVAYTPAAWDADKEDIRHGAASAAHMKTVVAGTDPVAIDTWAVRNLLMKTPGVSKTSFSLDDPDSTVSKFLRYYREVQQRGTCDEALIDAV
jgi:hypothetical protein